MKSSSHEIHHVPTEAKQILKSNRKADWLEHVLGFRAVEEPFFSINL